MKQYIVMFVALYTLCLAASTKCSGDMQGSIENEITISNSLRIVQSSTTWQAGGTDIISALTVIEQKRLTNAIPFLIPHISFSSVENPDISTHNLFQMYPVLGCLRRLGRPSADAIIEYVQDPQRELTPLMIRDMQFLLITIEGKEEAARAVAAAKSGASPEVIRRLEQLRLPQTDGKSSPAP